MVSLLVSLLHRTHTILERKQDMSPNPPSCTTVSSFPFCPPSFSFFSLPSQASINNHIFSTAWCPLPPSSKQSFTQATAFHDCPAHTFPHQPPIPHKTTFTKASFLHHLSPSTLNRRKMSGKPSQRTSREFLTTSELVVAGRMRWMRGVRPT